MPTAISTTNLANIANVTLVTFIAQYKSGGNVADAYYQELAAQGVSVGNNNIASYAQLAASVTTNSGANGRMANSYSESVAQDQYEAIDFSVGSDSWLEMQYSLMQRDLAARESSVVQGKFGELDYEATNSIHAAAFDDVGLPPEAYTLYIPTFALGEKNAALAQSLFEDLISSGGVGDNMLMDGLAIDTLNDWADTTSPAYWVWLEHIAEAIYNEPSILGSAVEEQFQNFKDAMGFSGVYNDHKWSIGNTDAYLELLKEQIPSWMLSPRQSFIAAPTYSPLVLDLDGDGVEVSKLAYGEGGSSTYFDMDNDGYAERTAWASGGDGILCIDWNNNGKIDGQSELFGNTSTYADGFSNLKQYDSNNDNTITSSDAQWSNLRVWVDANSDGLVDAGELKTLSCTPSGEVGQIEGYC